jgi:DNA-binding protein YbaB
MEPGLPPERMPARVEELRVEADKAMSSLRDRVAAAREFQQQAMGATGEATSGDGRVRVVVDATGVVTNLSFAPTVFENVTPDKLATTVVATIQAAAANARAKVSEAMAPVRADGEQARAGVAGIPELAGLRFDVPDVPRTVVDPSARDEPRADQPPRSAEPGDEFSERAW